MVIVKKYIPDSFNRIQYLDCSTCNCNKRIYLALLSKSNFGQDKTKQQREQMIDTFIFVSDIKDIILSFFGKYELVFSAYDIARRKSDDSNVYYNMNYTSPPSSSYTLLPREKFMIHGIEYSYLNYYRGSENYDNNYHGFFRENPKLVVYCETCSQDYQSRIIFKENNTEKIFFLCVLAYIIFFSLYPYFNLLLSSDWYNFESESEFEFKLSGSLAIQSIVNLFVNVFYNCYTSEFTYVSYYCQYFKSPQPVTWQLICGEDALYLKTPSTTFFSFFSFHSLILSPIKMIQTELACMLSPQQRQLQRRSYIFYILQNIMVLIFIHTIICAMAQDSSSSTNLQQLIKFIGIGTYVHVPMYIGNQIAIWCIVITVPFVFLIFTFCCEKCCWCCDRNGGYNTSICGQHEDGPPCGGCCGDNDRFYY